MDFHQGMLATYTAMAISHLNFHFLRILRFLKRNSQIFVIYIFCWLNWILPAAQNSLLPHARDTLAVGSHSFQPSILPRKDQLWAFPPAFPQCYPIFPAAFTFKSSSLKWPKDKLFEICSAQSGAHPERMETFPIASLSFGRFCTVHSKFIFMGNTVHLGVWRKNQDTQKSWIQPIE